MRSFVGGSGARGVLAAVFGAAVIAAVMMAVQPARAQEPRVVVRSFGSSASIGVGIRDVTTDDAAKAKQGQPSGVYIESVREGSPAAKAGIQTGDIVIDFDGERVRSASHFTRLVQESVPNREVTAVVIRGTSKQNLKIAPDAGGGIGILRNDGRRQLQDLQLNLPRGNFNFDNDALRRALPGNGASLGVTVSPLSDQLASYFGVKQGVLVSAVTSGSPAAGAGVRAGDVITAVNGQSVSNSGEITRALRQGSGESVEISVTRDKKSLSLKATLPARPRASGRSGLPV